MTTNAATTDDALEARWRAWQARAAAEDARHARTVGWLTVPVGLALAGWLISQLLAA
jgi:hypothetical protein